MDLTTIGNVTFEGISLKGMTAREAKSAIEEWISKLGWNIELQYQSARISLNKYLACPDELVETIEKCGFFESIPLWIVSLIGVLFIWVLSLVLILTVYSRFFKLYLYTAIAPIPLASFAGEPTQSLGKNFLKSYAGVCLQGAIIVLACIIYSIFAATPPQVSADMAPVTQVWTYIGELLFNMLILVGTVRMADRLVKEMMGV